jgi:hypothetical protein
MTRPACLCHTGSRSGELCSSLVRRGRARDGCFLKVTFSPPVRLGKKAQSRIASDAKARATGFAWWFCWWLAQRYARCRFAYRPDATDRCCERLTSWRPQFRADRLGCARSASAPALVSLPSTHFNLFLQASPRTRQYWCWCEATSQCYR